MVYFFWAGVIFSTENAKAWSFLANFDLLAIMSEIYVLIGVLFTGLNNVAVYQNGQIWWKGLWKEDIALNDESDAYV